MTVGSSLVWWGAGLGLGTAAVAVFLAVHGPGRRRRPRPALSPSPPPRALAVAPAPLRGEFAALSDTPDVELDAALRLWASMAAAAQCRVLVEAGADASGTADSNRKLVAGRARAAVVRLNAAGVSQDRIRVVHGSPQTAADEAARRRLRFVALRAESEATLEPRARSTREN